MRRASTVFAAVGGAALVFAGALELASGDLGGAGWLLVGPTPFYLIGLVAATRRPNHPVSTWLAASGTLFMLDVCLGEVLLPVVADWPWVWLIAMLRLWASNAGVVAGIGLLGLFPTGVSRRPAERWVIWGVGVLAVLVPVLSAVSRSELPRGAYQVSGEPIISSPFFVSSLASMAPAGHVLHQVFPVLFLTGVVMLHLRYRRSVPDQRRRIRWLLFGMVSALIAWAMFTGLAWVLAPGVISRVILLLGWPVFLLLAAGSIVVAVVDDGVLGIDRPERRLMVHRSSLLLITLAYLAAAAMLGLSASRFLPVGTAVLVAAGVALLFQPAQRWLERLADRWVFGARLDGYAVLSRMGSVLESAPGPDELLRELAEAVRHGLGVRWARVCLDVAGADGSMPTVGAAGTGPGGAAQPALVVPLVHGGQTLGRIECGPRQDGPLLDEDRRLLGHLSGQAAAAVRNVHLSAELNARFEVIHRQAEQLAASRARVAQAQDAERRRIQRDLHDGIQQDIVVLTANLALARERLRRGAAGTDLLFDDLQRDLGELLSRLREVAHSIHPTVLADKGLLEAIEAQAARLPLEVLIEADPSLRGVRYPPHVEAAGWYVITEAFNNIVKHAGARQVSIGLRQPNGCLLVEVNDDGRGFDPAATHGLGLTSLADRMSIVDGTLSVRSQPGRGTTLLAQIPLAEQEKVHD